MGILGPDNVHAVDGIGMPFLNPKTNCYVNLEKEKSPGDLVMILYLISTDKREKEEISHSQCQGLIFVQECVWRGCPRAQSDRSKYRQ